MAEQLEIFFIIYSSSNERQSAILVFFLGVFKIEDCTYKNKNPRPNIALLLVNLAAVFYVIDHTLHSSNPQNP